jgi:hypothetical protein
MTVVLVFALDFWAIIRWFRLDCVSIDIFVKRFHLDHLLGELFGVLHIGILHRRLDASPSRGHIRSYGV